MPTGFFLTREKRKKVTHGSSKKAKNEDAKRTAMTEEIPSDDEDATDVKTNDREDTDYSEDDKETAEEKRLRLAKEYLKHLGEEESQKEQANEIDKDAVAHRLKEDFLEQSGKRQKSICKECRQPKVEDIKKLHGHKLSVTCVAFSSDNKYIYSGSKDSCIIKWNIDSTKKEKIYHGFHKAGERKGHKGHIYCLDITSDNKYLASGGQDKLVYIWDLQKDAVYHIFKGHKDAVMSLRFRRDSHEIYSASKDRSVKVWSVDELAYVETLFGHQDSVLGIDCLRRQRPITVGGRDGSLHVWKIVDESYWKYETNKRGSMECVCMLTEDNFLSGTDDGSLMTWCVHKKKPTSVRDKAHRADTQRNHSKDVWITAVAAVPYSDLVVTGSYDGKLRLWNCSHDYTSLNPLFTVDVPGFINGLALSNNGKIVVCAIGQEHKLGRWWHLKHVKNCLCIIDLNQVV